MEDTAVAVDEIRTTDEVIEDEEEEVVVVEAEAAAEEDRCLPGTRKKEKDTTSINQEMEQKLKKNGMEWNGLKTEKDNVDHQCCASQFVAYQRRLE